MKSVVSIAVIAAVLAVMMPRVLDNRTDKQRGIERVALAKTSKGRKHKGPRTARAFRDINGHFSFDAMMNGTHVKVLVDTGASSVAINQSTARRIGIKLRSNDFRHVANTANGKAKFARAKIKEIRIGKLLVRNVEAAVLEDRALDGTLLGMSFLNKLKRFEIQGRTLKLTQ